MPYIRIEVRRTFTIASNGMALPDALKDGPGIREWAARYPQKHFEHDERIQRMLVAAFGRKRGDCGNGYLTRDELLEACRWKSGNRNDSDVLWNEEDAVIERSHRAFVERDYRHLSRIPPKGLKGVNLRTAVSIMHFVFPKEYPIIDEFALRALGITTRNYSHRLWLEYQDRCLTWAREHEVDLRTLDRALWVYGHSIEPQEKRPLC